MIGYFKNFNSTIYSLENNANTAKLVTNILQRSTFLKEVVNNTAVFYEYRVKEEDTPEIIADKLYGDAQRHWIVLLFNKIINPYYDFPMRSGVLDKYIQNKYNQTLAQSQTTLHHYELEVTKNVLSRGSLVSSDVQTYTVGPYVVNYTTGALTARAVPGTIDSSITYTPIVTSLSNGTQIQYIEKVTAVSNYNYEQTQNELRKTIKLIDNKYISQIEQEFMKVMSNA